MGAGEEEQEAMHRPSCAWHNFPESPAHLLLNHLRHMMEEKEQCAKSYKIQVQGAELPQVSPVPLSKSFQFSETLLSPAK